MEEKEEEGPREEVSGAEVDKEEDLGDNGEKEQEREEVGDVKGFESCLCGFFCDGIGMSDGGVLGCTSDCGADCGSSGDALFLKCDFNCECDFDFFGGWDPLFENSILKGGGCNGGVLGVGCKICCC